MTVLGIRLSMYIKKSFFALLLVSYLPSCVFGDTPEEFKGWFTGPLIASSGHTMTAGMIDWEPYLFVTSDFGFYDNARRVQSVPDTITVNPLLSLTMGLNSFMDVQLTLQMLYNHKSGRNAFRVGDSTINLGFQLLEDRLGTIIPDLRFTLNCTFPSGQYQNLDTSKNGVDSSGSGSYAPGVSTNFQKLFRVGSQRFLRTRLSFTYTYQAPVDVRGFNTYGGGFLTKGKVYPGSVYTTVFAFEYTLTKNWVLAMDTQYLYGNKTRFSGNPGINPDRTVASVGKGSTDQWSLAPAIEYNFNGNLGIITGVWFSVSGHNAEEFISGVIAVNYAY